MEFSRWLSEAWRATPPESMMKKFRTPEGCQICTTFESGIPPGCCVFYADIPVVSLAKPRSTTGQQSAKPPA
jgi:hypothetical protein